MLSILHRMSFKWSCLFFYITNALGLIFHVLVLLGFVPTDIIWGGRLKTSEEILQFELISIFSLSLFGIVILGKQFSVKKRIQQICTVLLWVFTILFLLNTIGNLVAKNSLETIIFTPITLISAILCVRLAIEKHHSSKS
jgi:hypothetical protein